MTVLRSLLLGALMLSAAPAFAQSQGRVTRDGAIVWRSSTVVATVRAGTILVVTARVDRWYEVIVPRAAGGPGERGLIAVTQLQLVPGSPEPPAGMLSPGEIVGQAGGRRRVRTGVENFVSVNGGFQHAFSSLRDNGTLHAFVEDAPFTTSYARTSGPIFDATVGTMAWGRWGVGVGASWFSGSAPATLTGSVPHPFLFNQPRSVSGDVGTLKRQELAVHVQLRGMMPIGRHLQITLFGGPSFFRSRLDRVTAFTYTQSYPYDVATLSAAQTSAATASKVGFHGGADVAVFFTRQIGLGLGATYSGATIDLPAASGGTTPAKAGGLQVGGGLRVRF